MIYVCDFVGFSELDTSNTFQTSWNKDNKKGCDMLRKHVFCSFQMSSLLTGDSIIVESERGILERLRHIWGKVP